MFATSLKPVSELKGVTSCCCTICGLVSGGDCVSCHYAVHTLCIQGEFASKCKKPTSCCDGRNFGCGYYASAAFPPSKDAPCSCMACGKGFGKVAEPLDMDGNPIEGGELLNTNACCCVQYSMLRGKKGVAEPWAVKGVGDCLCCCKFASPMRPCFATLNSPPPHHPTANTHRHACFTKEKTCYKAAGQCGCIDARAAFPPNKDIPCAIGVCGKFCVGKMPEGETMDRGKVAPAGEA